MPILKVVAETPEPAQGDTTDNPSPVPKASRTSVSAQLTTAPAATAGHDTPATEGSPISVPGWTTTVSIIGALPAGEKLVSSAATMCSGNVCSGNKLQFYLSAPHISSADCTSRARRRRTIARRLASVASSRPALAATQVRRSQGNAILIPPPRRGPRPSWPCLPVRFTRSRRRPSRPRRAARICCGCLPVPRRSDARCRQRNCCAVLTRMSSSSLTWMAALSRFCEFWIRNTIRKVTIVVPVLMTSCQVSEY